MNVTLSLASYVNYSITTPTNRIREYFLATGLMNSSASVKTSTLVAIVQWLVETYNIKFRGDGSLYTASKILSDKRGDGSLYTASKIQTREVMDHCTLPARYCQTREVMDHCTLPARYCQTREAMDHCTLPARYRQER